MYFFLPFSFLFPFLSPPPRPFRTRFFFLPFRPPILSKPRFLLDGYIGVHGRRCACFARRCQTRGKIRLGGGSIMTSASMVSDGWWNLVAGLCCIPRYQQQSLLSFSRSPPASECSIHPFRKRNTRVFGRNEGNGNKQAKGVNKRESVKKGMRAARGMQTERV